jgi:hypothetical protein
VPVVRVAGRLIRPGDVRSGMADEPVGPWALVLVALVLGSVALVRELLGLRRSGDADPHADRPTDR